MQRTNTFYLTSQLVKLLRGLSLLLQYSFLFQFCIRILIDVNTKLIITLNHML